MTLITGLFTGFSLALFNHWLTKRREKRKTSEERLQEAQKLNTETDYKLMTIRDLQKTMATKQGLINTNKSVKANGRAIKALEQKVDSGFEAINNKVDTGFQAINDRLDNLLGNTKS